MNEHVDELLALHALGGLEPDEQQQVEAHLQRCAACRAEADRQATLVAVLAASVPPAVPDPRLRARLLARAGIQATTRRGAASKAPRDWLALPRWLVLGASLALAVLVGWNVYLTQQMGNLQRQVRWSTGAVALISGPATEEIALEGQGAFSGASGEAYVNHDSQDVVLIVRRLDPLAAGRTYQAWLITDQGPVSAGLFGVTDTGWGMTWLDVPFSPGSAIGVSVEPQGGSQQPTEVVLLGGQ
jgi:anti-sigma-K factor RskA